MGSDGLRTIQVRTSHAEPRISPKGVTTIYALVAAQAADKPEARALEAPGRLPFTYAQLWAQLVHLADSLASAGITGADRVAVVAPGGPDLAVALLGVTAVAVAAPLNPDYTARELGSYFDTLRITALVTPAGGSSRALDVARERGLRLIELEPQLEAGCFTLRRQGAAASARAVFRQPEDVALLLQTSGTTSRPKVVPLTHTNLCAAALSIGSVLRLDNADACLNVMPLFHIHGFSALLSTLATGGRVICAPGFVATRFYNWLDAYQPTWYTAAPTIHQSILARAGAHEDVIGRLRLRFIRSASSSMPTAMLDRLESVFGTPVIEAYGMTEAAPQISSNPLPPGERRRGSVGRPEGPEIAIADEGGAFLPPGTRGEIVIQGANVMACYEEDTAANATAFRNGWLRTGDEGYIDHDGYLYVTGRIKDLINRGGEKIAPREVEDALLAHPAVAEAVSFAVPHAELEDEVGAAVVLHAAAHVDERDLRAFVAVRLAHFKVPRYLVIVPHLPTGTTAKVARGELARSLNLAASEEISGARSEADGRDERPPVGFAPPANSYERALATLWAEVLNVDEVGVVDDFFELGGDSILATMIASRIRHVFGVNVPLHRFFEASTVRAQAALVNQAGADSDA